MFSLPDLTPWKSLVSVVLSKLWGHRLSFLFPILLNTDGLSGLQCRLWARSLASTNWYCFISFSGATLIWAVWGIWPIGFNGSVPVYHSWGAVSLRAFLIIAYVCCIDNVLFSSPLPLKQIIKTQKYPNRSAAYSYGASWRIVHCDLKKKSGKTAGQTQAVSQHTHRR